LLRLRKYQHEICAVYSSTHYLIAFLLAFEIMTDTVGRGSSSDERSDASIG